ncbi:hypothetical protein PanWU01x14_213030, partial [Parasponia andersonii]
KGDKTNISETRQRRSGLRTWRLSKATLFQPTKRRNCAQMRHTYSLTQTKILGRLRRRALSCPLRPNEATFMELPGFGTTLSSQGSSSLIKGGGPRCYFPHGDVDDEKYMAEIGLF